jgi:methyl-accepting chemotaxis protein WspA
MIDADQARKLTIRSVGDRWKLGLGTKALVALFAAALPALVVAAALGTTLITTVNQAESDFEKATSAARRLTNVRVLVEKEHGLLGRLPSELDVVRINHYAQEIASVGQRIEVELADIAEDRRIVSAEILSDVRSARTKMKQTAAKAVDAARSSSHITARDLVNGLFEENVSVLTVHLDAIGLNVYRMADTAQSRLRASSLNAWRLTPAGLIGALCMVAFGVWAIRRSVIRPLTHITQVTEQAAAGARDVRIPHSTRQDEIGALSRSIKVFQKAMDDVVQLSSSVQKAGIQVGSAVTEIAATSKQQQATASEIAATTTQIGATSREISATSKELAKTMSEVSTVAEQTATLASDGQTSLSRMEKIMPQVMAAAKSINAKLAVLNEKAGNINQVVTTITKVADQTNLLSLNAAIEAEKAGEHGRGFAVVASEIRRLADQTAVATYDIEQIVKEIQSAISAGVMGMDKFSEEVRHGMQDVERVRGQLSQIIEQVQALVPRVEAVNEGMQAQATGAEQISEALLQLTEAAQQTAESLRQSASAIDDLNQVSGNLRSSVLKLAA